VSGTGWVLTITVTLVTALLLLAGWDHHRTHRIPRQYVPPPITDAYVRAQIDRLDRQFRRNHR